MTFPTMTLFLIECRTGCTCCSNENHYRGPYSTRQIAEKRVEEFKAMPLLASQYARQGRYEIEEHEAEQLPDGRLICGSKVYEGFKDDGLNDRIDGWD